IQGEDVVNSVRRHPRDEPRVVNLNAHDSVAAHQLLPDGVRSGVVGEHLEESLDDAEAALCLLEAQAKSAARRRRSGGDVPELSHVLRRGHKRIAPTAQSPHGPTNGRMLWVCPMQHTEKYATI